MHRIEIVGTLDCTTNLQIQAINCTIVPKIEYILLDIVYFSDIMKNSEVWMKPAAFIVVAILVIAGIFMVVDTGKSDHNIVPADNVIIDGQTYGVLDLLTDSGMEQTTSELSKFSSLEELNDIIGQEGNDDMYYYWGGGIDRPMIGDVVFEEGGVDSAVPLGSSSDMSYSTTNTQVSGVDEGDIVKNDDRYAYIASSDRKSLFIIDAYPAENARVVSEIQTQGRIQDIYISQDLLIVIQQTYYFEGGYLDSDYMYSDSPTVFVKIFDIENREEPVLFKNTTMTGYFSTSRVIDDTLYLITNHYNYGIYEDEEQLPLPIDCLYYMEDENAYYSLTNFMTLDFTDADSNPNVMGIYMSSASTIYVSQKNIYITHMKPQDYSGTDDRDWEDNEETTVIHRIGIQGQGLKYRARGEVPGWVLNRYSMDEHNGHFRIATTKGWSWGAGEDQSRNMVSVLDMALNETGILDNIAPGEQIYSARFMGQRCYLVTFRQIDPFFVIDLHDAENPEILGELKIPGYSSYLHLYDENHIIGLGKDGGNVKISLFNVTDVTNPTELDNIQIGDDYSDSIALNNPHAFNFDYEKNLLVIPVYQYSYSYYGESSDSGYCAMVFHISPENGITLEATIEHPEQNSDGYYWNYYYQSNQIHRSFFIGDTLYTVSQTHLKANNLENYGQEALVELG